MAERASAELPFAFLERMHRFLGQEYSDFEATYAQPPTPGLRVNTLKISPQQFERVCPYPLSPLPWSSAGFQVQSDPEENIPPGKHPYHAAGLYYLQDPSAMAVAEVLDPVPGERVLDISAAPGGKATQLAALLQGRGLLIANEVHPARAWDLAENLERWGVRNAAITNESPERLADRLGPFFDKVLVDAPCSGEGLFRKQPEARRAWKPNLVESCALRQGNILESAAALLKPGGILVYSTCTFSPEENEGTLARFLGRHPEFEVLPIQPRPGFASGRPDWLPYPVPKELERAVRLWPHHAVGEGHFMARLQKAGRPVPAAPGDSRLRPPAGEVIQLFQHFIEENLAALPVDPVLNLTGSYLYHIPPGLPKLSQLRAIHPGWWFGTIRKGRFEPSHALAMALQSRDALRSLNLEARNLNLIRNYLGGGMLSGTGLGEGWVLIAVDGFPLGWGKNVQGIIKNAYPRGLRRS